MILAALALSFQPVQLEPLLITEGLALPPVARYGRDPAPRDPIALRFVLGDWRAPKAGDEVEAAGASGDARRRWEAIKAGVDGSFTGASMRGGYLYASLESPRGQAKILSALGHGLVYVNGEPRPGDVYSNGLIQLPVLLKPGRNDLLFHVPRGSLRAQLLEPKAAAQFGNDTTLPDIVGGEAAGLGAIPVLNSTTSTMEDLEIEASYWVGAKYVGTLKTPVSPVPGMSARKVSFSIPKPPSDLSGTANLNLRLLRRGLALDRAEVAIRIRKPSETHKRTFVSEIDGSVQYYGVVPSTGSTPGATVLSLHGASVEAIGQAEAYSAKDWCTIVCPTNRRPFGFDWEDWGRMDALEVLRMQPRPYFLTGHSMGGHGTWHLGATFPGLFQGIGPSAGWISFWTYAGGVRYENPDPVERILARASSPSDTAQLARNLIDTPVYILHGDADDNVPVSEARAMRDLLQAIGRSPEYHEQKGAGHWWDASPDPGADCVDWKLMFQMFGETLRSVSGAKEEAALPFARLLTFNPALQPKGQWLTIERQIEPMKLSSVEAGRSPQGTLTLRTANVEALVLDPALVRPVGDAISVEVDGQKVEGSKTPREGSLRIVLRGGVWRYTTTLGSGKAPESSGPFKNAFKNRMVFVVGTKGTAEENAWAAAKARLDAETFWYRGNGAVDVVPDAGYDTTKHKGRNVILYGNSATNAAWGKLLKNSPLQVYKGWLKMGARVVRGSNLACLFVRPLGKGCLVGVVSGTGPVGMRLTDRLPYFVSGVAYPDWTIMTPELLKTGSKGIVGAGFFGNDWGYSAANSAWR